MPKLAYRHWIRSVIFVVLIGNALLLLLGVAWWITNLGTKPDYGDSNQYLELAESLRVDDYRTLFYPLVLRGLKTVAALCGYQRIMLVDVVQTILALVCIAYLGRALWGVTASTQSFSDLKRTPALIRRAVIGAFAMLVFSQPLVNHFALSVMTDSLAASFITAGLAALIRISTLDDTRLRTFLIGWLSIAAAGFMRAEKVYVMGLTIIVVMLVMWWLARPTVTCRSNQMFSGRRTALVLLSVLLLTPGPLVTAINRATQTADYGWPRVTINHRLFNRTVWPRLTKLRPLLSQEFQSVVSEKEAKEFDLNCNEFLHLVPLLQQRAGGTDVLVNEASWAAIRNYGPEIAITTADDALRYTMPLIAYPLDLAFGGREGVASEWTHTRMRAASPLLTNLYLWVATTVLLTIQIPVVCSLLWRLRDRWNNRVAMAAVLMLGVSIINAVLYSATDGLQNVRYALPACVLVFATVVWGNVVWLADSIRILRARAGS
jgi:hypothetical protein